MTLKKDVETSIDDNVSATEKYMKQINKSLEQAIEDEKQKKEHEQMMDAILSTWLALMFTNFEDDLYNSAQIGIDVADNQLKAKNITTVADETITVEKYEQQVQSRLDNVKTDFIAMAEEIKSNSSSVFNDLNTTITKEAREKLANDLLKILKENGITFFYDRAGRKWKIENYVKMRTMTELVQGQRVSFFTRAIQFGVDLVRIIHMNLHPQCPLCIPFNNKILSITGKTPGYMTIEEASMQGLFHPNCDHVPQKLELAPLDKGNEGVIILSEANKKRFEYNQKKNFKMF